VKLDVALWTRNGAPVRFGCAFPFENSVFSEWRRTWLPNGSMRVLCEMGPETAPRRPKATEDS
jgi:hypothetical protein